MPGKIKCWLVLLLILLLIPPIASADMPVDMTFGGGYAAPCSSYAYVNDRLYLCYDWRGVYRFDPHSQSYAQEPSVSRLLMNEPEPVVSLAAWNDQLLLCDWLEGRILSISDGLNELLSFSFSGYPDELHFRQTLCSGDNLYVLVFQNSSSASGDVYCISLTDAKAAVQHLDDSVYEIAPWLDGSVLTRTIDPTTGGFLFQSIADGRKEQVFATDNLYACGLAADPSTQTIYWLEETTLYAAVPGQEKQRIRAIPRDILSVTASFMDGQYLAQYDGTGRLSLYDLNTTIRRQLTIKGTFNQISDFSFAQANPDIDLYHATDTLFYAQNAYEEILTGDSSADLYLLPYSSAVQSLIEQGYAEPLSASALLMEDNRLLYDVFASAMRCQDELFAVPAYVDYGSWRTSAEDPEAVSVPQTLQEALDALLSWQDHPLNTGQAYLGMIIENREWTALDWLSMILTQALLNRNAKTPLDLTQYPTLAQTMELVKTTYRDHGFPLLPAQAARFDYDEPALFMGYGSSLSLYGIALDTFANYDLRTVTPVAAPACLPEAPVQYPAVITVYMLNPHSQHKEEAITYLEWLVQHRGLEFSSWLRTDSQPTLRESTQDKLSALAQEAETPAQLEAFRAALLQDPYSWAFASQLLPFYREEILPRTVLIADPLVERARTTPQAVYPDFLAQFELYLNDKCSAQQCLAQIQRIADMWWQENH